MKLKSITLYNARPKDEEVLEVVSRLAEKDGRSNADMARRLILAGAKVVEPEIK
jgi:hypothetical protein